MAKCEPKSRVVNYVLTLDEDEAVFLHDILRRVGGPPLHSRRQLASAIIAALAYAEVQHNNESAAKLEGFITCR